MPTGLRRAVGAWADYRTAGRRCTVPTPVAIGTVVRSLPECAAECGVLVETGVVPLPDSARALVTGVVPLPDSARASLAKPGLRS